MWDGSRSLVFLIKWRVSGSTEWVFPIKWPAKKVRVSDKVNADHLSTFCDCICLVHVYIQPYSSFWITKESQDIWQIIQRVKYQLLCHFFFNLKVKCLTLCVFQYVWNTELVLTDYFGRGNEVHTSAELLYRWETFITSVPSSSCSYCQFCRVLSNSSWCTHLVQCWKATCWENVPALSWNWGRTRDTRAISLTLNVTPEMPPNPHYLQSSAVPLQPCLGRVFFYLGEKLQFKFLQTRLVALIQDEFAVYVVFRHLTVLRDSKNGRKRRFYCKWLNGEGCNNCDLFWRGTELVGHMELVVRLIALQYPPGVMPATY